jgi:hypothetical protein
LDARKRILASQVGWKPFLGYHRLEYHRPHFEVVIPYGLPLTSALWQYLYKRVNWAVPHCIHRHC